jgi:hypothetical protein
MPNLISGACRAAVEGFVGTQSSEKRRDAYVDFVTVIVAFVVALIIIGFVGKLLWNNVVVDLFTIAKPARSVWQLIGLMFFAALMLP